MTPEQEALPPSPKIEPISVRTRQAGPEAPRRYLLSLPDPRLVGEEASRTWSVYLTPAQAAEVTGSSPYYISVMAQTTEGRAGLGFPVMRVGRYTKIPRIPFLRFMGWEGEIAGARGATP